jgi:hypothetical protein
MHRVKHMCVRDHAYGVRLLTALGLRLDVHGHGDP